MLLILLASLFFNCLLLCYNYACIFAMNSASKRKRGPKPSGVEKVVFYARVTPEVYERLRAIVDGEDKPLGSLGHAETLPKGNLEAIPAIPSPSVEEPYLDPQVKERSTLKTQGTGS